METRKGLESTDFLWQRLMKVGKVLESRVCRLMFGNRYLHPLKAGEDWWSFGNHFCVSRWLVNAGRGSATDVCVQQLLLKAGRPFAKCFCHSVSASECWCMFN